MQEPNSSECTSKIYWAKVDNLDMKNRGESVIYELPDASDEMEALKMVLDTPDLPENAMIDITKSSFNPYFDEQPFTD